jgi:hypothetical protein
VSRAKLRYLTVLSILLFGLGRPATGQHHFVRTEGTHLVDGQGHALSLRGTNLGNWLVREGYMFHFEGGPQSTREIETLTNELLGPEARGL